MYISSPTNPRIKHIVKLRERRYRDKEQTMIIEGFRSIYRAADNGIFPKELYICRDYFLGKNEDELIAKLQKEGNTQIFETEKSVFKKISYRDRPEGLLGLTSYFRKQVNDLQLSDSPLLVVAQSIEKPGNLGTIIRSADGTGADGLILCDKCTDLFNPNVITASTGMCFSLPIAEDSSQDAINYLKENKITIISATPHADKLYTEVDMTGPIAIIVGAEQYGLTEEWMEQSSINVKIPMLGKADSLNVATATTLLLYEAVRQRQQ
ncbi:RNA methyltransferase [Lentisphaera profundi]|uniref:RNA methyltransferase n=1 Tax=Lentisphaera profundi TaxID=1658616 RepID=A0ABY7VY55_9BACT|nr:RNA methyltransferase [Lentisphaera profundi]WDE99170.1 RNA methyltransferase [Lentisphaera profundi]